MRKGGSVVALIGGIMAMLASIVVIALSQLAISFDGVGSSDDLNMAVAGLMFSFVLIVTGALGLYVRNPIAGYFCFFLGAFGALIAPFVCMPFLWLGVAGAVFMIIGGHVDHHADRIAGNDVPAGFRR
ncbi:MAG: hypothetical protein ACTTJZ_05325 [Sphaerochaetaceae bacterium]